MLPSIERRISEWMPLISGSELVKSPAEALSVRRTCPRTLTSRSRAPRAAPGSGSVVAEPGVPALGVPPARGGVAVPQRGADVADGLEGVAVLQALRRVHADRGALGRADGDLGPARDVAAQVEDAAALGAVDLLALQGLHDADRLGLPGAEQGGPVGGAGARHRDRVPPAAPVAGGFVPPGDLAAGVVVLAAVPVRRGGRAQRGAPVVAAGDRAHPAVGQGHFQPGDQFGVAEVAVELAVAVGGADDVGHAVAEGDTEGVGAGAQPVGDVVGGVLDAFGEVRVGRFEDRVAHRFAVHGRVVHAQPGDVEAGAADPLGQGEVVGEQGQPGGQVGGGLPLAGDCGEPCGGSVGVSAAETV